MEKLVFSLLERLNIKNIKKEEFVFQIKSHPSFPSLHAITGVLNHFNIDNIALNIPINKESILELPPHFLAQIKHEGIKKIVLVSNNDKNYNITLPDNKNFTGGIEQFQEIFTGIIVAAEKDENIATIEDSKSSFNRILWIITIITLIISWIIYKPDMLSSAFLITSLIGILISIAIIKKELGLHTTIGDTFCSGENKKNDCDTVINSKEAKIFDIFKLSDISLIYFTSLSLLVFLIDITTKNFSIPYSISLIAVLITFYSIYYQYFVLKAWCGLCLSILSILWLQAALALISNNITSFSFRSQGIVITTVSFSSIAAIWLFIKPKFESIFELKNEKMKFYKFKRNFNLFNTLLYKNDKINTGLPNNESEIIFGNENGLPITIITNPFCGHCRAVHKMVDDIIKSKNENLTRITIRFNINTTDSNADVVKITSRLLEIYEMEGQEQVLMAMNNIYNGENPKNWLKKWKDTRKPDKYIKVLKEESGWCHNSNINFTPEILINGRSYPKEYERNDLIYFLEELYEDYTESHIEKNIN